VYRTDTKEQALQWAGQALDLLKAHNLAPTPDNFAVYYNYYRGALTELRQAMDSVLEKGRSLTPETVQDIHALYLGEDSSQKLVTALGDQVGAELSHILGLLDEAQTDTTRYTESLSTFSGNLQAPLGIDQIRALVSQMAAESKAVVDQNRKLQAELSASTTQMSELRQNLDKARQESLTDPLTGAGNRKLFASEMKRTMQDADDQDQPLSLLMVDIDHFKKFNDTHGHVLGDQVLCLVARTLIDNVKGRDTVCRYGGEEFAILLPNTRLEDAEKLANHLRITVGSKKITRRASNTVLGSITMSFGVAQYDRDESPVQFIERADIGLYRAKANGRNQVIAQHIDEALPTTMPEKYVTGRHADLAEDLAEDGTPNAALGGRVGG
jgi:diguanylate cyclase